MMRYFIVLLLLTSIFPSLEGQVLDNYPSTYSSVGEQVKTTKYLSFSKTLNEVRYWTDNNLDQVILKIKSGKVGDKNLIVTFPNSSKQYQLSFENNFTDITCINSDESEQKFRIVMHCIPSRSKFVFGNDGAVKEYLYFDYYVTLKDIYYSSSVNPNRILLEIIELDYSNNETKIKVKFPNDTKVYTLKMGNNDTQVTCTSPEGLVQTFYIK